MNDDRSELAYFFNADGLFETFGIEENDIVTRYAMQLCLRKTIQSLLDNPTQDFDNLPASEKNQIAVHKARRTFEYRYVLAQEHMNDFFKNAPNPDRDALTLCLIIPDDVDSNLDETNRRAAFIGIQVYDRLNSPHLWEHITFKRESEFLAHIQAMDEINEAYHALNKSNPATGKIIPLAADEYQEELQALFEKLPTYRMLADSETNLGLALKVAIENISDEIEAHFTRVGVSLAGHLKLVPNNPPKPSEA